MNFCISICPFAQPWMLPSPLFRQRGATCVTNSSCCILGTFAFLHCVDWLHANRQRPFFNVEDLFPVIVSPTLLQCWRGEKWQVDHAINIEGGRHRQAPSARLKKKQHARNSTLKKRRHGSIWEFIKLIMTGVVRLFRHIMMSWLRRLLNSLLHKRGDKEKSNFLIGRVDRGNIIIHWSNHIFHRSKHNVFDPPSRLKSLDFRFCFTHTAKVRDSGNNYPTITLHLLGHLCFLYIKIRILGRVIVRVIVVYKKVKTEFSFLKQTITPTITRVLWSCFLCKK